MPPVTRRRSRLVGLEKEASTSPEPQSKKEIVEPLPEEGVEIEGVEMIEGGNGSVAGESSGHLEREMIDALHRSEDEEGIEFEGESYAQEATDDEDAGSDGESGGIEIEVVEIQAPAKVAPAHDDFEDAEEEEYAEGEDGDDAGEVADQDEEHQSEHPSDADNEDSGQGIHSATPSHLPSPGGIRIPLEYPDDRPNLWQVTGPLDAPAGVAPQGRRESTCRPFFMTYRCAGTNPQLEKVRDANGRMLWVPVMDDWGSVRTCGKEFALTEMDVFGYKMKCPHCNCRVYYKLRTQRMVQFDTN